MAKAYNKFMDVDVFAFLEQKMKSNTQGYQSDFELDKVKISKMFASSYPHDKTLLWLSRPMGTNCVTEADAFVKNSEAHILWRHYAEGYDASYVAFAVELTGKKDGIIKGNCYELDYISHAAEVARNAVPLFEYHKTFEDGFEITVPENRSSYGFYLELVEEHGAVVHSFAIPADPDLHNFILSEQKAKRSKQREAHIKAPLIDKIKDAETKTTSTGSSQWGPVKTAEDLTNAEINEDPFLFTCIADKGYAFLVRGTDSDDAEKCGYKWYSENVFEPGNFVCKKTTPDDLKDLGKPEIMESAAFIGMGKQNSLSKPSLSQQIKAAEDINKSQHLFDSVQNDMQR